MSAAGKAVRIAVVCSAELGAELQKRAETDGRSVSAWCRRELARIVGAESFAQRGPTAEVVETEDTSPGRSGYIRDSTEIWKLKSEALTAGDAAQVELCDRALAGDWAAWRECERVINAAKARADEP